MATPDPLLAQREFAKAEINRLTAQGVLGTYTHFEVTEIFALHEGNVSPINVLSILVAEDRDGIEPEVEQYLGPRIRLKGFKGWTFGIKQYCKPLSLIARALDAYCGGDDWRPTGELLQVGKLVPVPAQFIPPDSTAVVPWNRVLKNNFWNGSYVFEWADTKKSALRSLLDAPPRLQELSEAVGKVIPISIASLSDRIGNIVLQLPITILIASFAQIRASGETAIRLAWHPKATPRPLRATGELHYDSMISGFASKEMLGTEAVLPTQPGHGELRGTIWDDKHEVILAATGGRHFIDSVSLTTRVVENEPRLFTIRDADGNQEPVRVILNHSSKTSVGQTRSQQAGGWTDNRIYREENTTLKSERRFVRYLPAAGQKATEHERALGDVRLLLNRHGEDGAWLWDPYLGADDILKTLFYCTHANADLRAMTSGNQIPELLPAMANGVSVGAAASSTPGMTEKEVFAAHQYSILESAKSNLFGLRLEYRIRMGGAGWPFHDRFLIFPKAPGGALAWSLGSSVNSLGHQHHILQRADDGQQIVDAFNDLWGKLAALEHLIWKTP